MKTRIAKVRNSASGSPVGWAELDRDGIPRSLFDEKGEPIPWPSEGVSVEGPTSNEAIELSPEIAGKRPHRTRRRDAILRYLYRLPDIPDDPETIAVKIEKLIKAVRLLADRVSDIEDRAKIKRGIVDFEMLVDIKVDAEII